MFSPGMESWNAGKLENRKRLVVCRTLWLALLPLSRAPCPCLIRCINRSLDLCSIRSDHEWRWWGWWGTHALAREYQMPDDAGQGLKLAFGELCAARTFR